jgi:hypothetical protein
MIPHRVIFPQSDWTCIIIPFVQKMFTHTKFSLLAKGLLYFLKKLDVQIVLEC